MPKAGSMLPEILDRLEVFYGGQEPSGPTDPCQFLIWWQCGYPPSDKACAKGWEALNAQVGVEPSQLLAATSRKLAAVVKAGGLIPELRARRIRDIARRVRDEFGGDLNPALAGNLTEARKLLKTFPGIADPGADRILLFGGLAPVPAVPSNCPYVLVRMLRGTPGGSYGETYDEAQQAVASCIPETVAARTRAYLLLKRHGQELCKASKPKCERCPVNDSCRYFAAIARS